MHDLTAGQAALWYLSAYGCPRIQGADPEPGLSDELLLIFFVHRQWCACIVQWRWLH
jgi:hypothetical protein